MTPAWLRVDPGRQLRSDLTGVIDEFVQVADKTDLVVELQTKIGRHENELTTAAQFLGRDSAGELILDVPDPLADEFRVGHPIGADRKVLDTVYNILNTTGRFQFELGCLGNKVHARPSAAGVG